MALRRLKLQGWDMPEEAEVEERPPSEGFLSTVYAKVLRPKAEPELQVQTDSESTLMDALYSSVAEGSATPAGAASPFPKGLATPPTTPKAKGLAAPAGVASPSPKASDQPAG